MKRAIDSSVAFKWVVAETHSDKAFLLRDDFRNGLVDLLQHWRGEGVAGAEFRSPG